MKEKKSVVAIVTKWLLLAVFVAGTVLAVVYESLLFGENSVFNKSVSENAFVDAAYQKIPALIRSAQIITAAYVLFALFRLVARTCFTKNNRSITVARLLESFVKWVVTIAALLFVLSAWGVDAGTLLASAGIVTLIIGLGAQSLVADIVAGVFMVFEGEFQVGDIVIINNWRGTVKEIGIRTTKIVDAGGNVNIVNNSEITTVINQTQDVSLAKCTVGIEYGESLPKVELIIADNLEKIRKNIPAILEGPYYKGVSMLNASSVDLLFVAKCKEEDIYQVQRDMNREIKILFDENDVNIPFPQIVLNQPSQKDVEATAREKNKAQRFVGEQKQLSKNLEDGEER